MEGWVSRISSIKLVASSRLNDVGSIKIVFVSSARNRSRASFRDAALRTDRTSSASACSEFFSMLDDDGPESTMSTCKGTVIIQFHWLANRLVVYPESGRDTLSPEQEVIPLGLAVCRTRRRGHGSCDMEIESHSRAPIDGSRTRRTRSRGHGTG